MFCKAKDDKNDDVLTVVVGRVAGEVERKEHPCPAGPRFPL